MTQPAGRINAALIPDAVTALDALCRRTRLNQTDVVNRALQVYDFLDTELRNGSKVIIRNGDGGEQTVRFL